jgi:hypothetical protein
MELPNDIASCHRIIIELVSFVDGIKPQLQDYVQQIEQLKIRVKELESQLHQNSRNSNYPSSMDKYKPKPAFPRIKGGVRHTPTTDRSNRISGFRLGF